MKPETRRGFEKLLAGLEAELIELEHTDPVVAEAADRYEQAVWEIGQRPAPRRFTKGCGGGE